MYPKIVGKKNTGGGGIIDVLSIDALPYAICCFPTHIAAICEQLISSSLYVKSSGFCKYNIILNTVLEAGSCPKAAPLSPVYTQ